MKEVVHGDEVEHVDNSVVIKPHTTSYNVLITFAVGLGSFLYGYSSNVIAGALALPSFNALLLATQTDQRIGGMLGIFLGGGVIGAIIQAPISDRWGRKYGMIAGAAFLTVGGALQSGSVHFAMFMIARLLAGIGSSIVFTIAPMLMSELAPAHSRGRMVSIHVISLNSGYLLAALGSLGFSYMTDRIQWRLNFIINTAFSLLFFVLMLIIPESPRWLVSKGRYDEAAGILERLHKDKNNSTNNTLARAEMYQIKMQVAVERTLPRGYIHIIKTPSLRKRAYCSILVWCAGMSTGVLVIANLTPLLFAGLGYDSTEQFGLTVAWLSTCIIGAFIGGLFVDQYGRRPFMLIGIVGCTITLALEAAMQAKFLGTDNKSGLAAGVAWFFLFAFFYNCFFDAGSFVYTAEIWPSHLRSEGVTISMVTYYGCAIAYNTPASVAFNSIGWKYYLVFICIALFSMACIWAYIPETTGLTLEEIGEKFGETPEVRFADVDLNRVGEEMGGKAASAQDA